MRHPVTYALAAVALFAFLAGNAAADPKFEGRKKCSSCHKSQAKSWKKTAHMSRQCYLGNKVPGSESPLPTSGLTEEVDNHEYSMEESETGYKNFCVVEIFIESFEWLYLAARGHRRAYFTLKNSSVEKKWLIP